MNKTNSQHGFTLVEVAIVLVILGLLLGGMMAPLSARQEQDRRDKNAELLEKAREALIGYAVVNRRLPCPDLDTPGSLTSGQENGCVIDSSRPPPTGRLPWVTLGIPGEYSAWGAPNLINYAVISAFTGEIKLTTTGSGSDTINIYNTAGNCGGPGNLVALNTPALIWNTAKTDYANRSPARADEAENANGRDGCYVYREYSSLDNQEFDDQMIWLSPNLLFNRMLEAGVLP